MCIRDSVQPGGDVDEDECDSKIACTELTILKKLGQEEFFLHALAYMVDHPGRKWNGHVRKEKGRAQRGFTIVRGADPLASGKVGDILAFAKETPETKKITQIAVVRIDGKKVKPNIWYDTDLMERKAA